MQFFQVLAMIASSLLGFVAAHKGMVDTDHHRDVGVVYTAHDFKGDSKFLFEVKGEPECMPLATSVLSIAICQTDVTCTFYTGLDCSVGPKNFAVTVGCGDVSSVDTPAGNVFQYYTCGPSDKLRPSNFTLKTVPHDASRDDGDVESK